MAKKTANGSLRGVLGPTVHFSRAGEEQVRVRPVKRVDKSQLVFDSRGDFKIIMKLIQNFKTMINIGFKDHKQNRSAYHSSLSVNRLNFNYAKSETGIENLRWFQFSEGNLSGAEEVSARKTDDGKVEFLWKGTQEGLTAHADDHAIVCIWIKETGKVLPGPDGILRNAGRLILDPGKVSINREIEAFIGFAASPRNYKPGSDRNVSKSRWVGVL